MSSARKNISPINGVTLKKGEKGLIVIDFIDTENPKQKKDNLVNGQITPAQVFVQKIKKSHLQSSFNLPPRQPIPKIRRHRLQDYLMSFLLLIASTAFGFGLAIQLGSESKISLAKANIAGVNEIVDEKSISSDQFDSWLSTAYNPNIDTSKTLSTPNQTPADPSAIDQIEQKSVLDIFDTSSPEDLKNIDLDKTLLQENLTQNSTEAKISLAKLSQRIDSYISTYRSYEEFDNQVATPLNGLNYIYVSQKTKTPLKYLLAISRAESRFGTDRYNKSGNKTRPGTHKNVCSIGLNDRGDNITFANYEEGLMACGKWYEYFENKKVSDCKKWRIFNPNGDYCSKITMLSDEIEKLVINPPQ